MITYKMTPENSVELNKDAKKEAYKYCQNIFKERAKKLGYKPKTKTYKKFEIEFFIGCTAMLDALAKSNETQILPSLYFAILRGDEIKF